MCFLPSPVRVLGFGCTRALARIITGYTEPRRGTCSRHGTRGKKRDASFMNPQVPSPSLSGWSAQDLREHVYHLGILGTDGKKKVKDSESPRLPGHALCLRQAETDSPSLTTRSDEKHDSRAEQQHAYGVHSYKHYASSTHLDVVTTYCKHT